MATVDRERYNLLYRPDLGPVRNWRSEAVFEEPDVPVGAIVPGETIDDVLQDLRDLEEVSMGLPEGLEPVNEIVTKLRQRSEILKVEEELTSLLPPVTKPPSTPYTPSTVPAEGPPTVPAGTGEPSPIIYPPVIGTPGTPVTVPGTPGIPVSYPTIDTIPGSGTPGIPDTIPGTPATTEITTGTPTYKKDDLPPTGTVIIPEDRPFVFVGNNVTTEDDLIPGLPTSFVPATTISLAVETPKTLVEIAQESYKSDQIDLQKFYLQKMRMALQRYFHHLLGLTAELGLSDPDMLTKKYDGDSVTGIGSNFQHLHDTIIRSQIQRLQKARIFKKMANADLTVTHMRSWNAAEKERERYYSEAYGDSENFVNSESNALLRQARSDYDAAYKLALYNMYKYLDASVKLTEDILDHTLTEAKAKAKLIKEGVNIFKTKEVTVTRDTNAVQSLQPKTKEQLQAEEKAEQEAEKNKGKSGALTPEDVDKARGIEDPDVDFDLAPSGGHYSKNDIDYLCNMNPEIYNRDTVTGKEAIKAALNQADKYMAADDSSETGKATEQPVNQDTVPSGNGDNPVDTESRDKVGRTTAEPQPAGGTVSVDNTPEDLNSESQRLDISERISGFYFSGYCTKSTMTMQVSSILPGSKTYDKVTAKRASFNVCNANGTILGVVSFKSGVFQCYNQNVSSGSDVIRVLENKWGSQWNTDGYGLSGIYTLDSGAIDSIMSKIKSF